MLPCLAGENAMNVCRGDAVPSRQQTLPYAVSKMFGPDTPHVRFREFRRGDPNSTRVIGMVRSPLSDHVSHVVALCPEKQVGGVAAGRVIARMADEQLSGICAVVNGPRDAMSSGPMIVDAERPIPTAGQRAFPRPALLPRLFGNSSPESSGALGADRAQVHASTLTHRLTMCKP